MSLKSLLTVLVLGTSSAAMASPSAGFSVTAHGSVGVGFNERIGRLDDGRFDSRVDSRVAVRDHRVQGDRRGFDDRRGYDFIENVSGSYSSNYGSVQLTQRGNRVMGTYITLDGFHGTIDGTIDASGVISFHWQQPSTNGFGQWQLARGGRLMGTWGNGRSTVDGGAWNLAPAR